MDRIRLVLMAGLVFAASISVVAGAAQGPELSLQQQEAPESDKIDLNRADETLLQTVPGIGPAMARRIVEWRTEHGPFRRLEDLLDVRGIGEKTLEKFRAYLQVVAADDGPEGAGGLAVS